MREVTIINVSESDRSMSNESGDISIKVINIKTIKENTLINILSLKLEL